MTVENVAQDIVRMWQETRIGKQAFVIKFEELADKMKGKKVYAQMVVNDECEEWEDEDDDR